MHIDPSIKTTNSLIIYINSIKPNICAMSYTLKTLGPSEVLIQRAGAHWVAYLGVTCAVVATIPLMVIFDLFGFYASCAIYAWAAWNFLKIRTTEIAVTNQRVVYKSGVLSINASELNIERVEGVLVHQDLLGKILNVGALSFSGTGVSKTPGVLLIKDPFGFRRKVLEAREDALKQRAQQDQADPADARARFA